MKKQLLITTLSIVALLIPASKLSAYCVYYMKDTSKKIPINVHVYRSQAGFKRAMQFEKIGNQAIGAISGAAQKAAEEKQKGAGGAVVIGQNVISGYDTLGKIARGKSAAKHSLMQGSVKSGPNFIDMACWNYKNMGLKANSLIYFGVVKPDGIFLGGGNFQAGGWVQLKIDATGTLQYAIFNANGQLRTKTPGY